MFLFSKYPCTTVRVELELDVSVCAQLKFLPSKTASYGLILQKLYFDPNNLSQIDVKR